MHNKKEILEEVDSKGNSSLFLAAKLSYNNEDYIRIVELLLANGANPRVKDGDGWTIIDEASEKSNTLLLGLIFDYMYRERKN